MLLYSKWWFLPSSHSASSPVQTQGLIILHHLQPSLHLRPSLLPLLPGPLIRPPHPLALSSSIDKLET